MQRWRFDMFYRGQFSKPAGLILPDLVEAQVDDFTVPDTWLRVVGLDFGGANTAKMYIAENPDTLIWYVYKVVLSGGLSTQAHVDEMLLELSKVEDYAITGGAPGETQQRLDWDEAGLYVEEPIITDVEGGLDRITQLASENRLKIFRSCIGLNDEIGRYMRKTDELGNPLDEIKDKRRFHRIDALRYASIYIIENTGPIYIYVDGERVTA